jgi:hypothetical protein
MHFHRNKVGALYNICVSRSIEGSKLRIGGAQEEAEIRRAYQPHADRLTTTSKGEKTFLAVPKIVHPEVIFWQDHPVFVFIDEL